MKVLVTGADGFVGRQLVPALERAGHSVIAASGPGGTPRPLEITSLEEATALVEEVRPDGVVHLAGFSSVSASHKDPAGCYRTNTIGTVNVLSAVKQAVPEARVLVVGSGEMYGSSAGATPIPEDAPARPLSPYAASKAAAELAANQFHASYGTKTICTRSFAHIGPGQSPAFVVPAFAQQLGAIRAGRSEPVILVGNLDAVRDFSHVSDVIEGYRIALERGLPGERYNVCSGAGLRIAEILQRLIGLSGLRVEVRVDQARLRPSEIPVLVGSPAKLEALGWTRKRTVDDALREVLIEQGGL